MSRFFGKNVLLGLIATGMAALLAACGEVGGSGQCGGIESNGVCLTVDSITPFYLGGGTSSVDVSRNFDCEGDGVASTDDIEAFTSHQADVEFSAVSLVPAGSIAVPPFFTITSYQIDFFPNTGFATGPDLLSRRYSETFRIDTDSTGNSIRLVLVDLDGKDEWLANGGNDSEHPTYSARYTFFGTDAFDNEIVAQGVTTFEIGGFDYCSASAG